MFLGFVFLAASSAFCVFVHVLVVRLCFQHSTSGHEDCSGLASSQFVEVVCLCVHLVFV